jgi:hypothetical protein
MVEAQDRQSGTSMEAFAETYGFFPATVESHEIHPNGMTLNTIDRDPDSDIRLFDDEPPQRFGELREEESDK